MLHYCLQPCISGCHAGCGCVCVFLVCGWSEWLWGMAVFNDHESSSCCSVRLRNCVGLWSVGCWPDPCTWWCSWPPHDCVPDQVWVTVIAPLPNSHHSSFTAVISLTQVFQTCVIVRKFFWNAEWIEIHPIKNYPVAHADTTDVTTVLSTSFLRAIPPYILASLMWRPTDNYI